MSDTPSTETKFKGIAVTSTILVLFAALWIFFAILIPITGGSLWGSFFCICVIGFLVLIGRLFLFSKADVFVNKDGISRILFGKRVQFIPWDSVQRVVTYPVRGAGPAGNVTAYNIIASPSSRSATKKIYFNDQSADLSELKKSINYYITKYQLRAEHVANGTTRIVNSL